MARARMPIRNTLHTDERGRTYLYLSVDIIGNVIQNRDYFEVTDEGSGVYKVKLTRPVAITQQMLDDTNNTTSAFGTGVTQTFSIAVTPFTLDFTTVTFPLIARTSEPRVDTDGLTYFYLQLGSGGGYVGAGIRVIVSTLYKNIGG